jgi:hypothetical protein
MIRHGQLDATQKAVHPTLKRNSGSDEKLCTLHLNFLPKDEANKAQTALALGMQKTAGSVSECFILSRRFRLKS